MKIQELERLVGIERATIRFYEKEGLISPARAENGYRNYSDEDAAELRRIKLLRELGVSLDTIRNLQAGTEDCAAVMRRQSQILQGRRDQMERARIVCDRISLDNATYQGLDIERYQNLLNTPLLPQPAGQGSGAVFEEHVYREPHPWRRFFARFLDHELMGAALYFVLTVGLRWRFVSDWFDIFVAYAAWFLMVPTEAAWIHFCGTTPAKWIFGIRVEAAEGERLGWYEALDRAWRAYYVGMGLNIPGLRLYCFYKGYKAHKEDWDTQWDDACEISFRDFRGKNILLVILACVAAFGVNLMAELDSQLPKYRSNELTVAQFAKNYNFYDELLMGNASPLMDPDGTMREVTYTEEWILPEYGKLEYDPWTQFEYEMDADTIRAITFHHTWYDRNPLLFHQGVADGRQLDAAGYWMPVYCNNAMITAIASQKGLSSADVAAYIRQMNEDQKQSASDGCTATYGAVTCSWQIDLECIMDYPDDSNADAYQVTLDLRIEFP